MNLITPKTQFIVKRSRNQAILRCSLAWMAKAKLPGMDVQRPKKRFIPV